MGQGFYRPLSQSPFYTPIRPGFSEVQLKKATLVLRGVNAEPGISSADLELNGRRNYVDLRLQPDGIFQISGPPHSRFLYDIRLPNIKIEWKYFVLRGQRWVADNRLHLVKRFDDAYSGVRKNADAFTTGVGSASHTVWEGRWKGTTDVSNWRLYKSRNKRKNPFEFKIAPITRQFLDTVKGRKIELHVTFGKGTMSVWEKEVALQSKRKGFYIPLFRGTTGQC